MQITRAGPSSSLLWLPVQYALTHSSICASRALQPAKRSDNDRTEARIVMADQPARVDDSLLEAVNSALQGARWLSPRWRRRKTSAVISYSPYIGKTQSRGNRTVSPYVGKLSTDTSRGARKRFA
jgi:hypothetical protein